ncbi:MAG: FAD-dependent monooxygenase [Nitratireductor sp.]|nr:FAD-dependent monooxygenase [Nitratireductor sp.]
MKRTGKTRSTGQTASIERPDVAIIGGGLAGLIAAHAAAQNGFTTILLAPPSPASDSRTTAFLSGSVAFLRETGIWDAISDRAHALRTMRIVDGTKRLFRAPQADFHASEIGLEAFGYNLENRFVSERLHGLIAGNGKIGVIGDTARGLIDLGTGSHAIETGSGRRIEPGIILAADGRHSLIRQALAIETRAWAYPQIALVANVGHSLDHHDVSTEFHTENGPLTLVPLGSGRSSLVWVVDAAGAERLEALSPAGLAEELETRIQSFLGKIAPVELIGRFPLSGAVASAFGKANVMLIGEAGHAFPPIGAQGLNLGIRDIRAALETAASAKPGEVGRAYHAARAADIHSRTASVDLLNRSLLSGFLPVQAARSFGLYALSSLGPLRRLAMREGTLPGEGLRAADPLKKLQSIIGPNAARGRQ